MHYFDAASGKGGKILKYVKTNPATEAFLGNAIKVAGARAPRRGGMTFAGRRG